MSSMHGGFGEIDLDLDDLVDEDPPPSTKRLLGSAKLEIEDKMEALFTSATWTLTASVVDNRGKTVIARSTEGPKAHTRWFTMRWAREAIRSNKRQLRKLGVDVDAAYVLWGGKLEDLEETG
jgi:hypothetical protein